MKRITLILLSLLFAVTGILAQTPNQFKYQAVLRDATGNILADEAVTVDISILQNSATGTSVFSESHSVTTTAQGLINISIGSVNTVDMANIAWGTDSYFVSMSVNGTEMGTSQLLSVPFALYAANSGSSTAGPTGAKGDKGDTGATGPAGAKGNEGSSGSTGTSAYQHAVNGGFVGTEAQWLASFGTNGKSAYQHAVDGGYADTEANWLLSLKGDKGDTGLIGTTGKSAYQHAVDGGYSDTEANWLLSLKGDQGIQGIQGIQGPAGSGTGDMLNSNNLSGLANTATARTNLGIGNVDDVSINSWTGTSNISTVGTIGTGTWQGTVITDTYIDNGITASNYLPLSGGTLTGNIISSGTFDGRDVSTDGTKLDAIESSADVTDATNVASAGAVMDGDFSSNGFLTRTGVGAYSVIADNSSNWNTAHTDRLKWDGGATGLNATTARTSLGLVIGTNVQAFDADLTDLADGTLSGSKIGTGIVAGNISTGTIANARINWAEPDAIGGTTQAAGAFSTLRIGTSTTAGRVLTADGSGNATWQVAGGGASQLNELSDVNTSTATSGNFLVADGTDFESVAMSGDVLMLNSGTTTIQDNSVDGTDIALGSDAIGDVMYYNGTDWVRLAKGTDDQVLTLASGVPSWAAASGGSSFVGARAYNAVAQDIDIEYVQVEFGTENFDEGNNFANNEFTAPTTGYYRVSGRVQMNFRSNLYVSIYAGVDDSTTERARVFTPSNTSSIAPALSAALITDIVHVNAGEVIQIWAKFHYDDTDVTVTGATNTWFTIEKL